MSFYEHYLKYKDFDFEHFFKNIKDEDILRILQKRKIDHYDFLTLLSPKAEKYLEEMAKKANELTISHFGKAVVLFTPMYIGNYCINRCAYCGFHLDNKIKRKKLTMEEIEKEAKAISKTGLRHILVLTGESPKATPVEYIVDAVGVLKKYFDSIGIEIYPLTKEEYEQVVDAGVDLLTVFQEVYDENIYDKVHLSGPKKDYRFRLDTAERACMANIRNVSIGALLGLNDFRKEAFMTGLHASYLQDKYSHVGVSVSLPRIRPHVGFFEDTYSVNEKNLVQNLLALRIYLPFIGITVSTRERAAFRENLIPLGVTKLSAGVTTEVGGHSVENKGDAQFDISDTRSVEEMKKAILEKGYQPVLKDWMII